MGNLIDVRRKIALNTPHIETAISSGITAFKTDMRASLKACKIGISVIQSGSGDPSPTNVRPLTGHTGVILTHSGVNLLQCDTFTNGSLRNVTFTGTRNSDGEIESISVVGTANAQNLFRNLNYVNGEYKWPPYGNTIATFAYCDDIDVIPAGPDKGLPDDIYGVDGARSYLGRTWRVFDLTQNWPSSYGEWFRLQGVPYKSNGVTYNSIARPMVCLFEDAGCEYEPYKGQSYTVDWSSTAGTIYGGYLDIITGELVVTHGHIKCVGNEDWLISSAINGYCAYRPTLLGVLPKFESGYVTPISDKLKGVGQYATGLYQVTINYGGNLYFGAPEELSTKKAVNAWVQEIGGIDIVYELASPIVYQLTPIQIKTFVGRNNIWSTGNDEVEVKYWVHKPYDIGIPIEYKQCDYIQTTGGKARFDTGVPGNDTTLQIAGDVKEMTFGAYNAFIGNHVNDSSLCWRIMTPSADTGANVLFNVYRDSVIAVTIPSGTWQNLPFRFKFLIRQNYAQVNINGTVTTTNATAQTTKPTNNTNIAVGSRNPTGESGTATHRIYSVRIWSHNELIRDYKPCIRRSDNVAGFYDMVNRTFNPSTGSTQFIAGND